MALTQIQFSKKLTHNNSKSAFYFSCWFSDNLLHKFLEKLIFHSILLILPLSPYIQGWIWFFGVVGRAGNIPSTSNNELEGEGRGHFNWQEKGRGHFQGESSTQKRKEKETLTRDKFEIVYKIIIKETMISN